MRAIFCVLLSYCLTFSTWLEPSKLFAQCSDGYEDDTVWSYPYDPCEFYLTAPWSCETSNNMLVVFLSIGLGCIAGMIAGNVALKHKHHHDHHNSKHHHHHSVRNAGIDVGF
jgi:hypothetical protein